MAESEKELKMKMKVKEESEKSAVKLNIHKKKIMATDPITSWKIDGETMETVRDFFFEGAPKSHGDCSHEIKRRLILGRKAMTNLDSISKSRDITLPTKVCIAKAMVFHNKLWKILKEMGIPDHLTCLLRNLYAGQESTVRTKQGTTDWFQIGKGVCQGCIL